MKKSTIFLAAGLIAASFLQSCKVKDGQSPTPVVVNRSSNLSEFFENNGAKKQAFTVNVDNGNATIIGKEGTKIIIPENAFVTSGGASVTGPVEIQLVEIFDQAGMVLSNRPTTSDGSLLVSGGEFYIGATSNGDTLQLSDNTSILVTLPAETVESGMTVFTGGIDSSQFNWTPVPNVVPVQTGGLPIDSMWTTDSVNYFYYDASKYIFTVTTLGWINCDRFYNVPNTDIQVSCNGIADQKMVQGYIVFKNINSVSGIWWSPNPGAFVGYNLPIGEEISIVVFCMKDGKEYVGIKETTVTDDLSVSVDLEEASEEDIVALINSKFN